MIRVIIICNSVHIGNIPEFICEHLEIAVRITEAIYTYIYIYIYIYMYVSPKVRIKILE
jgi:hypothetical protein